MFKLVIISILYLFPINAFGICNSDDTFDATASIEIPKPKGFFSGTPEASPEIIEQAKLKAQQNVLQAFIGKCITDRNKLDRYIKMKSAVDTQTSSFISIIKSKQSQDKLILNVKIRASVNAALFESILFLSLIHI